MDDNQNVDQIPKKEVRILLFDKQKTIKYFGKCKLLVDPYQGLLTITLKDEGSTVIECYFNHKFLTKETLFCVINSKTNKNMMIFYPRKESCIKVFNGIINFQKQKFTFEPMTAEAEETLFKESFFVPILKEIQKYPLQYIELRTIMFEFVQSLDEEERKTFLNLKITVDSLDATANSNVGNTNVKEIDYVETDEVESEEERHKSKLLINDSLLDDTINTFATDDDLNNTTTFGGADELMNDADKNDENDRTSIAHDNVSSNGIGGEPTFSSINDMNTSGTYNLRKRSLEKSRFNISFGASDDNGSEDDLYNENEEDDENYDSKKQRTSLCESQNIDLSNHEFVEYSENGSIKKKLLIFTSKQRSFCYVYTYNHQLKCYRCSKCNKKSLCVSIKILTRIDGTEKLEKGKNDHMCQPILYSPDDYKSRKTVYLPNYEIVERKRGGKVYPRLLIFDATNRELYYEYLWVNVYFRCKQCWNKHGRSVYAKLIKSKDGEYIELGRAEHQCDLTECRLDEIGNSTSKIVHQPDFKIESLLKKNSSERKILSIVDPSDKTLSYKYTYNHSTKRFVCNKCISNGKYVSAKQIMDGNGKECIQLSSAEHICQSILPDENVNLTLVRKPNFEIETFIKNNGKEKTILTIFDSSEKNLMLKYFYSSSTNRFLCCGCNTKKKCVYAKKIKDKNGDECIQLSSAEHICQFQSHEDSERIFVHEPNFKLETVQSNGSERKMLKIFNSFDKNLFHEYTFLNNPQFFVCCSCRVLKNHISAKLCQNEDGKDYIELSNGEHVCEYKYIQKTGFEIYNENINGRNVRKLKLFTEDKFAYIYNYSSSCNYFKCISCTKLGKHLIAEVQEDEEGKQCLKLSKKSHGCQPQKVNI